MQDTNNTNAIAIVDASAPVCDTPVHEPACEASAPSMNDMLAEMARLKAENAALKVEKKKALGLKVSQKGAVSLYGLGRFPVTLYAAQWERLLEKAEEIKAFIAANEADLNRKE